MDDGMGISCIFGFIIHQVSYHLPPMNSVDASGHFHLSERFSLSLLRKGLQAHWQVQLSDQVKETVTACRA
jgi:hypothetical protein